MFCALTLKVSIKTKKEIFTLFTTIDIHNLITTNLLKLNISNEISNAKSRKKGQKVP